MPIAIKNHTQAATEFIALVIVTSKPAAHQEALFACLQVAASLTTPRAAALAPTGCAAPNMLNFRPLATQPMCCQYVPIVMTKRWRANIRSSKNAGLMADSPLVSTGCGEPSGGAALHSKLIAEPTAVRTAPAQQFTPDGLSSPILQLIN